MDIPKDRTFCGIGLMGDPDRDCGCSLVPVYFLAITQVLQSVPCC